MGKSLLGIDFNSMEITMNSNGKCAYETMPTNLVDASGVVSPESLAQFIKQTKRKKKIRGKDCAVLLPENATFFRTVDSPIISDEQLKLNLPYEFRDFVGVDSIDYSYDYMVEEITNDQKGQPETMHLVAAAALKSTVEEYQRILKRAGLKMKVALPHEVSMINLMKQNAKKDKEYCFIGVGYDFTRIYIFNGSKLRASKTFEIGNHQIDRVIASVANCDEYIAAGYRDNNHQDVLSQDFLAATYESIAFEVMKTINFYRYEHNDTELDTCYFFSMGSDNEELCRTICSQIGFEKGDIREVLPSAYKNDENAARALLSIGLTV